MKKIHWILLIVLTGMLSSCKPSPGRYSVTVLERQMIPYQIGDTVRFRNEHGETITLTFAQETSKWDLKEDNMLEEHRSITLQSESKAYKLFLTMLAWGEYGYAYRCIAVVLNSPHVQGDIAYDSKGNLIIYKHLWVLYDSISIDGHTYYDVSEDNTSSPYQSYYNKTHGVLQMKKDGKAVFTLQEYIPAR
ncbi:MAG: hypothetical protein NC048_05420 [Bacteroides sp.]|nr:hypothetical protein [Ruminococcus flavefaciens]MCM1554917.1 hypothetical protein [Bacteroides sp.]